MDCTSQDSRGGNLTPRADFTKGLAGHPTHLQNPSPNAASPAGGASQNPNGSLDDGQLDLSPQQPGRKTGIHGEFYRQAPPTRCPVCASSTAGNFSKAPGKALPVGLADKIHFMLFVSMCIVGAAVMVDTGPFPFNFVFGTLVAILPFVLVIKRHRSGRNKVP